MFSEDRFVIDLGVGAVTCPGGVAAPIRPARAGGGTAYFGPVCAGCPPRVQCTTAADGHDQRRLLLATVASVTWLSTASRPGG